MTSTKRFASILMALVIALSFSVAATAAEVVTADKACACECCKEGPCADGTCACACCKDGKCDAESCACCKDGGCAKGDGACCKAAKGCEKTACASACGAKAAHKGCEKAACASACAAQKGFVPNKPGYGYKGH